AGRDHPHRWLGRSTAGVRRTCNQAGRAAHLTLDPAWSSGFGGRGADWFELDELGRLGPTSPESGAAAQLAVGVDHGLRAQVITVTERHNGTPHYKLRRPQSDNVESPWRTASTTARIASVTNCGWSTIMLWPLCVSVMCFAPGTSVARLACAILF